MGNQVNSAKETLTPKKTRSLSTIEEINSQQIKSRSSQKDGLYTQDKLFENYESSLYFLIRYLNFRLSTGYRSRR
jgi:hypothetical protein